MDRDTGGRFSVVEHTVPHVLAAPLHYHSREDEYSYVLEGRLGALLGDQEVFAEAGDLVFKPRGQWHTVWNPGDTTTRLEPAPRRSWRRCWRTPSCSTTPRRWPGSSTRVDCWW